MTRDYLAERTVSYTVCEEVNQEMREYSASFNAMSKNGKTVTILGPEGDLEVPLFDVPFLIKTLKEFLILHSL